MAKAGIRPRKTTKRPTAKPPLLPRKRPRQDRAQATVDAILEATGRILREHGYDGLSTNKVAEAAGVSVGSLYQYFPGKDALVTALLLAFADAQQKQFLTAMLKVQNAPLETVIRAVVVALMESSERDPVLSMVLMNQIPRVGELGEIVEYFQERVAEPIYAFLVARKDDIAVKDLRSAAFVLAHTVQPLLQRVRFSKMNKAEREAVFEELTRMLTRYVVG